MYNVCYSLNCLIHVKRSTMHYSDQLNVDKALIYNKRWIKIGLVSVVQQDGNTHSIRKDPWVLFLTIRQKSRLTPRRPFFPRTWI